MDEEAYSAYVLAGYFGSENKPSAVSKGPLRLDFFRICFNFSPVLISSSISTSLANFTSKNDQGVLGQLDCQVVRQTYSYAADKLVFIWEGRPSTITVVCRG
uniref:Uncharacterized protein n=1 Tax=Pristionchus pacificus TaxID=54126 RepID=A0A2A6D1N7_PRIPA|eukprot:PDM84392.1 hypothetical protein PRIPAC_33415 [Pristionchus pacificus]